MVTWMLFLCGKLYIQTVHIKYFITMNYLYICNMEKQTIEGLLKISSYAFNHKKSVNWVHNQIKDGKIQLVEIDGVKFIKVN